LVLLPKNNFVFAGSGNALELSRKERTGTLQYPLQLVHALRSPIARDNCFVI
jgi:hypothetical protein